MLNINNFEKLVNTASVGLKTARLVRVTKAFHNTKVSCQEAMGEKWLDNHPVLTTLGIATVELCADFVIGSLLVAEVPEILNLITKDEEKEVIEDKEEGVE